MHLDIFLTPFLTGLCFAIILPVLGCYLRVRDEWLAALAYAHVAAAGTLLALAWGGLPVLGGLLAAGLVGSAKHGLSRHVQGNALFPVLLLMGWSLGVLVMANHPSMEQLGQALFDGQLYFASDGQLAISVFWSVSMLAMLRLLSKRLLLSQLYPDFFHLRGLRNWPVQTGFDLLAALSLALATMSLGVMGAFALVFLPPWVAFRHARNWRHGLILAVSLGVVTYLCAFMLALLLDQPFGPILVLVLMVMTIAGTALRHWLPFR